MSSLCIITRYSCILSQVQFRKQVLELPPELCAGEAVDGEVDEAVEDGAELDDMMKDNCIITRQIAITM